MSTKRIWILLLVLAVSMTVGCIESTDNVTEPALNLTPAVNQSPAEVTNEILVSNGNEIFEKIDFNDSALERFSWLVHFETATPNTENFKKSAANGTVKMKLSGDDLEIEFQQDPQLTISGSKSYHGKVLGEANSRARFIVSDGNIIGKVEIENKSYYIEQTNRTYNGKTVVVIYSSDDFPIREIPPKPEYYQTGELKFTALPEKSPVQEGERFKIHLTLTNTGNNTINVWKMYEQISYFISFSNLDGSEVPYNCAVLQRLPLTNEDLVELNPGESISATFDSRCWSLKEGKYILSARYRTSTWEAISEPYWLGEVQSKKVLITVE